MDNLNDLLVIIEENIDTILAISGATFAGLVGGIITALWKAISSSTLVKKLQASNEALKLENAELIIQKIADINTAIANGFNELDARVLEFINEMEEKDKLEAEQLAKEEEERLAKLHEVLGDISVD